MGGHFSKLNSTMSSCMAIYKRWFICLNHHDIKIQHFQIMCCKLHRSLYGLRQSPWVWYKKIQGYLIQFGFTPSRTWHITIYLFSGKMGWSSISLFTSTTLLSSVHLLWPLLELSILLQENSRWRNLGDSITSWGW